MTSPTALVPERPWHFDGIDAVTFNFITLLTPKNKDTGVTINLTVLGDAAYDTAELICRWSRNDANANTGAA